MDALARANEIRSQRAQLKRDLKAGRHSIQQLLLDPPEYLETAKVFDMLLAVPKYGRVKVNKILTHCRISPRRRSAASPSASAPSWSRCSTAGPAQRRRLADARRLSVGAAAAAAARTRFSGWSSSSPARRASARER